MTAPIGEVSSMRRANYIGAPEFYHLNQLCVIINEAFGDGSYGTYLVGSSLKKRDYRDVDLRCIMKDEEFDKLFPDCEESHWLNAAWSLICSSISEWLAKRSGLPIDFQIQRMTQANRDYPSVEDHPRSAIGIFFGKQPITAKQP